MNDTDRESVEVEVFSLAARLVRRGWVRGRSVARLDADRLGYCAMGALIDAERQLGLAHEPARCELMADVIGRPDRSLMHRAHMIITTFNDLQARDADDVATVLETCAAKLRANIPA